MISLISSSRVYIAPGATDMCKSINGLALLVADQEEPGQYIFEKLPVALTLEDYETCCLEYY